MKNCPTDKGIISYLNGEIKDEVEKIRLEKHLEECNYCQDRLNTYRGVMALFESTPSLEGGSEPKKRVRNIVVGQGKELAQKNRVKCKEEVEKKFWSREAPLITVGIGLLGGGLGLWARNDMEIQSILIYLIVIGSVTLPIFTGYLKKLKKGE